MISRKRFILAALVLACAAMALVETVLQPGYFLKSVIKITLFAGAALGYQRRFPGELGACFSPRGLLPAVGLGAGIFAVILGAFFLFRPWLDLDAIGANLLGKEGVSRENFLYVALYISLCNSLLEELLFRGLGFALLRREVGDRFAGVFSAGMFALYHVAILDGWMNWWLFGLCMAGLFLGGLIFNFLDRRGSILPSWLAHGAANLAINTVGLMVFGMI